MTTALSIQRTEGLAAFAKPVPVTASLAYHVAGDTVIDGMLVRAVGKPSQADISEAQRKLQEAEHLCRPADARTIAIWCQRMKVLPWAPADTDQSQAAITAICMACGELPAGVWTAETAAIALRTWVRWPAPAQIYELLSSAARPFWRSRDGLRRVAGAGDDKPQPAAELPGPDAQVHVAALVKAFVAERSFNDPNHAEARPPVAAKPLSDGALLAVYEREASGDGPFAKASATKAEFLRKRLAKEADFYA